jgi:hypothetical protein
MKIVVSSHPTNQFLMGTKMRRAIVMMMNVMRTPETHTRIGPASSWGGRLFISIGIVMVE